MMTICSRWRGGGRGRGRVAPLLLGAGLPTVRGRVAPLLLGAGLPTVRGRVAPLLLGAGLAPYC